MEMLLSNAVWMTAVVVILLGVTLGIAIWLRTVVPTNRVHVVQSAKRTTSYGGVSESNQGNVYWAWPSWVPKFGVTVIGLPISNFDLSLNAYEAYDKNRVPFVVDVVAFFRITDTDKAARRVKTIEELQDQLNKIVQGAVRKVLASDEIDSIMLERAKFGDMFTDEVAGQLEEWGVESVKAMELMDIRDSHGSNVIENIMAKQTSFIDMESRTEVATNKKKAETAEIEAQQEIDVRQQEAEQVVGERTAEKDKAVGIATEQSQQEVLTEQRETTDRQMEVRRVEEVKTAEIERDKEIVAADQEKQTTVIVADGKLEAERREATGIEVVGTAKAAAEQAMQMAPVEAKIALAKEIGTNPAFQAYLQVIEAVAAQKEIGIAQASALVEADLKVIANTGDVSKGAGLIGGVLSSQGGTNLAASLEALANTPMGKGMLDKFGITPEEAIAAVQNLPEAETSEAKAQVDSDSEDDALQS